jgi:hypothetical protein
MSNPEVKRHIWSYDVSRYCYKCVSLLILEDIDVCGGCYITISFQKVLKFLNILGLDGKMSHDDLMDTLNILADVELKSCV